MTRAVSVAELEPLLALCRSGRFPEVQEWIRAGNPVALPVTARGNDAAKNPLRVAMGCGFHSVVQALLESGAPIRHGSYDALRDAVEQRRPDLVRLFFDHGASANDVSMRLVMEKWQPEVVDLFLAHDASLDHGNSLAWGLVHRTRPALGLLKRLASTQSGLMRQAETALRVHAREGNKRGVALMLWAGASPWARGPDSLDDAEGEEGEEHPNAVEIALLYGNVQVLKPRALLDRPNISDADSHSLLEMACHANHIAGLALLLEHGHTPERVPAKGAGLVRQLLHSMTWDFFSTRYDWPTDARPSGVDNAHARERMKMLHMLVAAGARWLPEDTKEIAEARRCLLKMRRPYVLEFVWLMRTYRAGRRSDVRELLRTPAMGRLLADERPRANRLLAEVPEAPE